MGIRLNVQRHLRVAWSCLQVVFFYCFWRRYRCKCGHIARYKELLIIDGQRGCWTISRDRGYCAQCFLKAAIKCAWCGQLILPGDPITLYSPRDKDFKIPEHAVVYEKAPRLQLVGCLGWDCAESGADRAGFWVMPGKVDRVMTVAEMIMSQKLGDDGIVIINDLSDPNQATHIEENIEENNWTD